MITAEHIRHARVAQLAALFDTSVWVISRWSSGKPFSGRKLQTAASKGIPLDVLVQGIELRRQDGQQLGQLQDELDSFLTQQGVAA